jgi:hypothetical protein
MYIEGLVFGLLDISNKIENPTVASRLRSITLSWSRFGYYDPIIENSDVNRILDEALKLGHKFCLIQAYGHVISEKWYPKHWQVADFQTGLRQRLERSDFFITGHVIKDEAKWYGLDEQCLLVNLDYYEQFGRPAYHASCDEPIQLSKPLLPAGDNLEISNPLCLWPSDETEICIPGLPGWNFIHTSLKNGKAVCNFNESIRAHKFNLRINQRSQGRDVVQYLDPSTIDVSRDNDGLEHNQPFLRVIDSTIKNAKRGVFLWNLEPYTDVEEPPPSFRPPLSRLYSVAAGLKPNRILHTHGFNEHTEVVFFDYSPNALKARRLLHEEWDGEDYPRFIKFLFEQLPYPETFYHLWAELSPEMINWDDMRRFWEEEIDRWGGEHVIKNHWLAYRELKQVYVQCNILTEQHKLLEQIDHRPGSVIWWSNAFFTFYSNWLYPIDERKKFYDRWIDGLLRKNPELFLYGSDYNNISVNAVQVKEYVAHYSQFGGDYLTPRKLHKNEIRF